MSDPESMPAALWREPERRRLVRLCAAMTGDRDAAEDLAQETLLEAWRNAHKLHDPTGADRWLTAVARNVCRRWARSRGRHGAVAELAGADAHPGEDELERDLERSELAELVDRALGLLPAETRRVLVERYVDESPHADIAARLGISEDAVSMRLTRGKVVLRRLLATELGEEAAAHELAGEHDGWHETRVWCSDCGRRRLHARRDAPPGAVRFRCPGCSPAVTAPGAELRLANPFFARLVADVSRPAAILSRVSRWSHEYYGPGAGGEVACTRCGTAVALRTYRRPSSRPSGAHDRGLYAGCPACGEHVSSSVAGLALGVPEVRRFRRDHPRAAALPQRDVDYGGAPAVVVRYESLRSRAGVDVVLARDTLRVLDARATSG